MVSCGCPPTSQRAPPGQGAASGLGCLAGCSVDGLAALGWPIPGALDTLSMQGVPQSCGSQRPELTPASPLKAVCPWLASASTLEGGGRLSPLTWGFPQGTAQHDGTRQIAGAPSELTVFRKMLLKPADRAGGWGVFFEPVGSSGHPSPLPLCPDSPTWP